MKHGRVKIDQFSLIAKVKVTTKLGEMDRFLPVHASNKAQTKDAQKYKLMS